MAQVATSTIVDNLAWPNTPAVARDSTNGRLYVIVRTATNTLSLYRSTDGGGSWAALGAGFSHTGLQEWSSFVVDKNGLGHLAYRIGDGTSDSLHYRYVVLSSGSWVSALQISNADANGGSIGSRWQGLDLAVVRMPNAEYRIAIFAHYYDGSGKYGLYAHGVGITGDGYLAHYNNDLFFSSTERMWLTTGTNPGRSSVNVELEHTGDGFTSSTPHLWVSYGRTTLRMVKLSWQGSWWQGPTNPVTIRSGLTAHDQHPGRWDGTRWMMGVISPDDTSTIRIYQRNQANTATTTLDTPVHPAGAVTDLALSYDLQTKNLRVYAAGTSSDIWYFVDYVRATSTWGAWAQVVATAVLNSGREWSVKRGGTTGNARHDIVYAVTGSPNTIQHLQQSTSTVPHIATWNTSAVPYFNGGGADVGAALTLDWDFSDPDPGQGQGSYALSRQIGAGALSYWRASDSTWQATEQQNTSATTQLTLASGWGAGTDANHTYKVKVWDSGNTPSTDYSAGMVLVPSVPVNPTITAPTAAQVIGVDAVTVTWTVSEQTERRVRLMTNPGAVVVHDSGFVATSDLSYTVPYTLANGSGWTVELTTRNNERLSSAAQSRNFTVSYVDPPASISTFVPSTALGYIAVTSAALAPVGTQPAIISQDLYRRVAATPPLNANPSMAGNVTGWAVGGSGTGALTYSTTQFHDAPGSARYVPNGAHAAPTVEASTKVDVVAGNLYTASAWVRPDTAAKPLVISLNWYTAANAFISATTYTLPVPVAGAWHYLEVTGDPATVATAAKVTVAVGETGTPLAADAWYADEIELEVYDSSAGVRVAAALGGSGSVFNDRGAASGVDYEYRWVSTSATGSTITGPWTA